RALAYLRLRNEEDIIKGRSIPSTQETDPRSNQYRDRCFESKKEFAEAWREFIAAVSVTLRKQFVEASKNQLTGHLPVARCASKSPGKSLSALSMGGPGIEIRLQNPFPLLKAITFPNCSIICRSPCPCWSFFRRVVSVLVSIRQAGY